MEYPSFFDDLDGIVVRDELASFLGVNSDGVIEFSYLDLVKIAGHSCAVVAGGYLIALKGLKALYGDEYPVRGNIKVELRKKPTEDNAGVVGYVLSAVTGATTDFGFGGLPEGRFNRRGLLFYGVSIDTDVRFTRLDTHKSVGINYRPGKIVEPESLLRNVLGPNASEEDKKLFPVRFQGMVERILKHADEVIEIV